MVSNRQMHYPSLLEDDSIELDIRDAQVVIVVVIWSRLPQLDGAALPLWA
jgi:hypothetical protein